MKPYHYFILEEDLYRTQFDIYQKGPFTAEIEYYRFSTYEWFTRNIQSDHQLSIFTAKKFRLITEAEAVAMILRGEL